MSSKFRNKPVFSTIAIICFTIISVFTACNPAQRPFPQNTPPGNVQPGQVLPTPNPANATGDATLGLEVPLVQATREQMFSYRISNELINMPEVDRVNVLVTREVTMIGFMPSDGYKNVSAIRDAIIDRVNSMNLPIGMILVSESADVMIRINQINTDIINGRPLSEINFAIDKLKNRMLPPA